MKRLIYLASPYSHESEAIKEKRFELVCEYAAGLMKQGLFVYSPIAHTHPISRYGLPGDWDFWESYDTLMISKCDEIKVLQIPGWQESKGVQAEIQLAKELNKPISYIPINNAEKYNYE